MRTFKTFHAILANSLAASLTNTFVWFAVTFWVYLQTKSVLAMSFMAGIYLATVAGSGFFLGSVVDRYPKKHAMLGSSIGSLVLYGLACLLYAGTPARVFSNPSSVSLWVFIVLALFGAIAGNLRSIALSTLVTVLVPEHERDKANGLVGSANGIAFLLSSVLSGLVIGYFGMFWMLVIAIVLTVLVIANLMTIALPTKEAVPAEEQTTQVDIRGTIQAIRLVPGLFGLIFFSTFNNFLGGVFMALMDAYGLLLVTVQQWGILWGVLSLGFIVGGLVVAKKGLGTKPLRTLFLVNIVLWVVCIFFTIHSSIVLFATGMFVYLCLVPAVEAAEQTILQKTIPPERQGRVFGFAQSLEQAASPLTAFLIGPVAQYVFIPFMSDGGAGADLIGSWYGTGQARGIALLFSVTGIVGLIVTALAMRSYSYRKLSESYQAIQSEEAR
ncbi:MAG: MFS transporter [Akkermansiaceae bacterium]|nr:MFS transporter [Armatimonadota bacterium]